MHGDIQTSTGQSGLASEMVEKSAYQSRTIGQNIDMRIASLTAEIMRLQSVRGQLESGASLLEVRIEDLRQAMNY